MSTPSARLAWGDCVTIDYTPGSDITAGDVVVQNDLIGVAPSDIDSGVKGSLQIVGPGGVWIFPITSGSGALFDVGEVVYWDDTNDVAVLEASSHKVLGKVVEDAGASDTELKVMGGQQATP